MDYSELKHQLSLMTSDQKCTGFQLYKYEKISELKENAENLDLVVVSETILNEWNALTDEVKQTLVEKEQTLRTEAMDGSKQAQKQSAAKSKSKSKSNSTSQPKVTENPVAEEENQQFQVQGEEAPKPLQSSAKQNRAESEQKSVEKQSASKGVEKQSASKGKSGKRLIEQEEVQEPANQSGKTSVQKLHAEAEAVAQQ